ncbi:hypothetical protein [Actinomycetospora lemnae]|uniref:Uncharacterized protein n=1 Tax=Actinomycetospora lemnae TaxID=3019891 RepID=A0ABT5STM1_9PSEU|nr:hypothetical protein [Actinomycetospora sp. DW7H6]MDD7966114.1 hypothetical protein [Actinomycetospora sp. DW7H6]
MNRLRGLAGSAGRAGPLDERVAAARARVWRVVRPRQVPLRADLLRHRGALGDSPLRAVSTPKGCAVQVLLVILFEVTCRRTRLEAGRPTTRALRHSEVEGRPSWQELIATPTVNRRRSTGTARTPEDNRSEQLRAALARLEAHGRIQARYPEGRGRFEGFALLNEASDNLTSSATTYRRPKDDEPAIKVPVEFWINGWVHVLSDSEIVTYLYLLARSEQDRRDGGDGEVAVSAEDWEWAFGGDRAGLVAQRHLARFGLIDVERAEGRRSDGTVEGGGAEDAELPFTAHRYRLIDDGLRYRAAPKVLRALKNAHDLDLDTATWPLLHSAAPDGWTFEGAVAELQHERLAAPPTTS